MSENPTLNREELEARADALRLRLAAALKRLEQAPAVAPISVEAEPATAAELAAETSEAPREKLEAEAKVLRRRLAWDLDTLVLRWHEAFQVKRQLAKHAVPTAVVAAGTLLALGGGAGALIVRARMRKQRLPKERFLALTRAWRQPEKVARAGKGPIGSEIGRGVLVSVATLLASQLVKRGLQKLLPELWDEPQTGLRS